jgi:hypothetical protein
VTLSRLYTVDSEQIVEMWFTSDHDEALEYSHDGVTWTELDTGTITAEMSGNAEDEPGYRLVVAGSGVAAEELDGAVQYPKGRARFAVRQVHAPAIDVHRFNVDFR